ncbi:winged helix-turn-helix domain-containing protein [Alicyclobacillus dauci]|uniref:Winged helix-turn-helix domain-containing protein n=1 Tax=Alicyclobacillus dauci TaxID=1475485 RepID=A0ABY6Z7M3_9BACL|nr:winged helix-turn-helix domain-containing protein [Alicyclobacillus dauci]WAH38171.1 winged helix-turn-helix domain-containing protein [Alicyclobacillus dauci]
MDTETNQVHLRSGLVLDVHREELVQDGMSISLSRIQFRILHFLVQSLGRPVRTEDILAYAWGKERTVSKSELYVYISRLRARIGDNPRAPRFLISIRGFGYLLRSDANSSEA